MGMPHLVAVRASSDDALYTLPFSSAIMTSGYNAAAALCASALHLVSFGGREAADRTCCCMSASAADGAESGAAYLLKPACGLVYTIPSCANNKSFSGVASNGGESACRARPLVTGLTSASVDGRGLGFASPLRQLSASNKVLAATTARTDATSQVCARCPRRPSMVPSKNGRLWGGGVCANVLRSAVLRRSPMDEARAVGLRRESARLRSRDWLGEDRRPRCAEDTAEACGSCLAVSSESSVTHDDNLTSLAVSLSPTAASRLTSIFSAISGNSRL